MKGPTLDNGNASNTPLYTQVEQYLRQQIASGDLGPGDKLPSVQELCRQFGGINHLTVRRAIKTLVDENIVRSIQGRGSFITEHSSTGKQVAIVLPHLEDTIFIRIARGAQQVLDAHGVRSFILDSRGSETAEADQIQNLRRFPVDGALIYPIAHSNIAEQIFQLRLANLSFVLVDRYFEDIASSSVVADNRQGGTLMGRHLAEKGHQRIAWIGESRSISARLRFSGFLEALNDAGLACPRSQIKNLVVSSSSPATYLAAFRVAAEKAVDELLTLKPPIDAIACCNDPTAIFALKRLRALGRRVPEDIAVMGFDDVPEAEAAEPSLTTIRQPMEKLGQEAACLLLDHLSDKKLEPKKIILPVELVIRQSA